MYCPKCATQNLDNVKFCRSCGTNIELVPQALTGKLPEPDRHRSRRRHRQEGPPDIGEGIQKLFLGFAFMAVAASIFLFMRGGRGWWFWLLIPAFMFLGRGLSTIFAARQQVSTRSSVEQTTPPAEVTTRQVRARDTGELPPVPPSVTEGTTKLFDEASQSETKH
jgi:hypothetical protein